MSSYSQLLQKNSIYFLFAAFFFIHLQVFSLTTSCAAAAHSIKQTEMAANFTTTEIKSERGRVHCTVTNANQQHYLICQKVQIILPLFTNTGKIAHNINRLMFVRGMIENNTLNIIYDLFF